MWAVEVGQAGEEGEGERTIDWKQAYKTLFKMILKIKVLVVKAGKAHWVMEFAIPSISPGPLSAALSLKVVAYIPINDVF